MIDLKQDDCLELMKGIPESSGSIPTYATPPRTKTDSSI